MKNRAKKLFLVLLCLGTAWSLSAQTTIKGIVTDDAGEPLIGAGVVIEGTQTGTVTGIDGDYTLEVPAEAVNLVFSFISVNLSGDSTGMPSTYVPHRLLELSIKHRTL
ncbi:MAG: carboxypeptidase-like regulatory domain-containing protein [Bacteroidales bacterium]|nr:carboxypeptidase-like regulatory domain-containing protein [Bacteroidales bacterium]